MPARRRSPSGSAPEQSAHGSANSASPADRSYAGRTGSNRQARHLPGTCRAPAAYWRGHPIRRSARARRSEEHTSELQSLMRISYAVFCLKKKKKHKNTTTVKQIHDDTTKTTQQKASKKYINVKQ